MLTFDHCDNDRCQSSIPLCLKRTFLSGCAHDVSSPCCPNKLPSKFSLCSEPENAHHLAMGFWCWHFVLKINAEIMMMIISSMYIIIRIIYVYTYLL